METSKNESDIAPLIPDTHLKENNIKKIECCDFLQCGACALIIIFTCFKP
jgi:hypothetical protein